MRAATTAELKHGPLALVTSSTTIDALLTGERGEEARKNAEEAPAAPGTSAISPTGSSGDPTRTPTSPACWQTSSCS